jgi:hypothetical protein
MFPHTSKYLKLYMKVLAVSYIIDNQEWFFFSLKLAVNFLAIYQHSLACKKSISDLFTGILCISMISYMFDLIKLMGINENHLINNMAFFCIEQL